MPYQGAYPGYYPPPPPPPKKEGWHPAVYVGIGVAIAVGVGKLMDTVKSKQNDIQQAMMQQMLKSMMARAVSSALDLSSERVLSETPVPVLTGASPAAMNERGLLRGEVRERHNLSDELVSVPQRAV